MDLGRIASVDLVSNAELAVVVQPKGEYLVLIVLKEGCVATSVDVDCVLCAD